MKTVLVTGANGQLGNSIHARISQYPGYNFSFYGYRYVGYLRQGGRPEICLGK